jgi:hypothetical protein
MSPLAKAQEISGVANGYIQMEELHSVFKTLNSL